MYKILLICAIFSSALAQYYCNFPSMNQAVKIGDSVIVCLQIPSPYNIRVAFNVTVDTYTALQANGVYDQVKNITGASIMNITSNIAFQFNNTWITSGYLYNGQVSDLYSFVIRTVNGIVTQIESDNQAYVTAGCINNSTSLTVDSDTNCFKTIDQSTSSNNDPKLLISWIGTDSSGAYMLSQTRRLSRFTQFSIQNVYTNVMSIFS